MVGMMIHAKQHGSITCPGASIGQAGAPVVLFVSTRTGGPVAGVLLSTG